MDILDFLLKIANFIVDPNVLKFGVAVACIFIFVKYLSRYIIKFGVHIIIIAVIIVFFVKMAEDTKQIAPEQKEQIVNSASTFFNKVKEGFYKLAEGLKNPPNIETTDRVTNPPQVDKTPLNRIGIDISPLCQDNIIGPLETNPFYSDNIEAIKLTLQQGLDKIVPQFIPSSAMTICYNGCLYVPKEGLRKVVITTAKGNIHTLTIDLWESIASCEL